MKQKTLYICEICKTEYKEKKDAEQCEASHIKPKRITTWMKFHAFRCGRDPILPYAHLAIKNYPDWIDIEMQDGKTVRYKR